MKYQIEEPSDQDIFASKGHENSAFAIKDTLENHENVHVIGLEGSLGAGKSTVLRLLKNNLNKDKFQFITFDVEKYHTSTKPSFIKVVHRELTDIFGQNDGLDNAKNRALGNEFSYKKKVDSNLKIITAFFILAMVFAARFAPDAVKPFFYTPSPNAANSTTEVTRFSLEHNLSLFFAASPLIILALSWFLGSKWMHNRKNRFAKRLTQFPKIGDIINKNGTDTVTETLLVNKEVGSTELEAAFEGFIEKVPDKCTVILVIDNLDRVESEKVREVWSDLEIFTSICNGKFRVIVPFSEEHIAKALSSNGESNGQEFISKRLPVVFKAPPIVSAGWREPFRQFWDETLLGREGFNQCCDLIDIWVTSQEKPVTPRLLKKHVNDIATLIISNKDVSPNAAVCSAYILVNNYNRVPFKYLLLKYDQIPDETHRNSIDRTQKILRKSMSNEKWTAQLMCVHFQSNEDIARSELLGEPIRGAISSIESHKLFELSKLFGFKEAFEKYIELNDPYDVIPTFSDLLDRESIDETDKLEWINTYLNTVNHYLDEEKDNTNPSHYDHDLIFSYKKLIDNQINIDTTRIKNEALALESYVQDEHTLNKDELLVQLYDYSYITGSTPSLIKHANPSMFFELLWNNQNEFENWNIDKLRTSEKETKENIKFLEENSIDENFVDYFNSIKKRIRINSQSVANQWGCLSNKTIENITNLEHGHNLIPFTTLWTNPNSCKNLLQKIFSTNSSHRSNMAWISVTTCYLIQHKLYNNSYATNPQNNNQDIASNFIKNRVGDKIPDLTNFLKHDLLFITPFQKIVDALKNEPLSGIISDSVKDIISENRVDSIDKSLFTTNDWEYLSDIFKDDKKNLLNWISRFELKKVNEWSNKLIKESIAYKNEKLIKKITNFIDDEKLDINFWGNVISSPSDNIIDILELINSRGKKLKSSPSLSDCIIDKFNADNYQNISIEVDIFNTIMNIINSKSKSKILRNIMIYIEANSVNHDYIYFLIKYFNKFIFLPENLRIRYSDKTLTLFDHIKAPLVADWFDNQDWSCSEWTTEQVIKFVSAVEDLNARFSVPNLAKLAENIKPEQVEEDGDENEKKKA
ncbi:hypothetical protein KW516_05955 [Vibrio fluvialis]|nr:hypothetical protein [Vibrio fluvialis]